MSLAPRGQAALRHLCSNWPVTSTDVTFQLDDVCIVGPTGPIVELLCDTGAAVNVLGDGTGYWHRAHSYFTHIRAGRFDVVHVNIGGRLPKYFARLARCGGVISHVHGAMIDEVEPWRQGRCSAAPKIMRNYVQGAQRLVASSNEIGRMLTTCCPSVASRVSVIPYGVDLDRFQPVSLNSNEVKAARREIGLSEGDMVVGFVGRLVPQKGLSYLLAAAELLQARYGNLRFVVVGDGPLGSELKTATASFRDSRFHFLGRERSDVPRLMGLFDMLGRPLGVGTLRDRESGSDGGGQASRSFQCRWHSRSNRSWRDGLACPPPG